MSLKSTSPADEKGEIVIYQTDDGLTHIDVRMEDDTVWLTQQQMAGLFHTSRTNVVEHIQNIYGEGELNEEATCRKFRQVRMEGSREVSRKAVAGSVLNRKSNSFFPSILECKEKVYLLK